MATKKKTEDIIEEEIIEETVTENEPEAKASGAETEVSESKETYKRSFSPLADEGVRGDGTAKWYVVHTYSGYENKVKNSIDRMVEYRGMQDRILEVVIPTEDRIEIKDGVKKVKTRKLFPGYVVIKMIVDNETWYLVRNTEGVTGFVGHGSDPIPLTKEEIVRMGIEKMKIDLDIEVGDTIRIIGGVFEGQLGIVEAVNPEKQIVKVKISMFGRDTPAEIEFSQVSRLR
ncbi:MAG: transcription termination/antitermination factor NusG [Mogibacterium sp.]|nr:transcription termination/antitermination factor NusG [Mogibacterium sp.]